MSDIKLINDDKIDDHVNYKPVVFSEIIGKSTSTVYEWTKSGKVQKATRMRIKLPIVIDVDGTEYINGKQYKKWLKEVHER